MFQIALDGFRTRLTCESDDRLESGDSLESNDISAKTLQIVDEEVVGSNPTHSRN